MTQSRANSIKGLIKVAAALAVLNEIRGLILAAPVLLAMYQSGGSLMAWWLGFCVLAGIALSVVAPAFMLSKIGKRFSGSVTSQSA